MQRIYLDHNATTPIRSEILHKTMEILANLSGNPSSTHSSGRKAKAVLEDSREKVAQFLKVPSREILFTSCGTEADNLALLGSALLQEPGNFVCSAIEHPGVLRLLPEFEGKGWQTKTIMPLKSGVLSEEGLVKSIAEGCDLLSVQLANNETGVVQPVQQFVNLVKKKNPQVIVHTDAVQALGKMNFNLAELGVDLASFSGHKIGAFKGVGVLWNRHANELKKQLFGGPQERDQRPGTENLPGIISMGLALDYLSDHLQSEILEDQNLRDQFEMNLLKELPDLFIHGKKEKRLSNTSSILFNGAQAELMLMALDLRGFDVSAGSACSSGTIKFSKVIHAMGYSENEAGATLRFSFGRGNSAPQIDRLVEVLKDVYTLQLN